MLRTSLVLLVALMIVAGCSDENPVSQGPKEEISPLDALVITNCKAVQAAAEAFAVDNNGRYPTYSNELMSHLGSRLENPYTNLTWEPTFGFAAFPGQTGYFPYVIGVPPYVTVGYLITGYGADGEVISLSNLPRDMFYLEDQTIANCYTVLEAVEAFASENNGVYPTDIGADTTPSGKTVTDLLPGGRLLVNPYTLAATEPTNGSAAVPGGTGYLSIYAAGYAVGCRITAWGTETQIIEIAPLSLPDFVTKKTAHSVRRAVEDFAAENDGVYPYDVDTDTSLLCNTVIDLLNGSRILNSYTDQRTEPRNGYVTTRGQVGYVRVFGSNIVYVINAWGLFGEVERLVK